MKPASRPIMGTGEQGFILIAAIWLLILAGSIVAILMLRSMSSATAAADRGAALTRKLALESAAETVLADRLFNGGRSNWWFVPTEGTASVGNAQVHVRVSSESGRLDINEADVKMLDAALQGFAISGTGRTRILGRIGRLRAEGKRVASFDELVMLFHPGGEAASVCLADYFTFSSGLASPRAEQMPEALARAMGQPGATSPDPVPAEAGAALRISASFGGQEMTLVARTIGMGQVPVSVLAAAGRLCP